MITPASVRCRFAFASLLACGLASLAPAAPKVAVVLKGRLPFWQAVEKGAVEEGEKLGADVVVKAPQWEFDISTQIKLVEALANQGVEALVIAPSNRETLAPVVAKIAERGIKIVVIDSPLDGGIGSVFVGTDQNAAGEAAGRLLASLVGDHDEVCLLRHSRSSAATAERETGAMKTFAEAHPTTLIHADIYASAEKDSEPDKSRLLLDKYPNAKAVLASGTNGTLAMLRVLEERKLAGTVKLIGFGFNLNPEVATAIENGALTGWVAQLPIECGREGVECACRLLKGEQVPATVNTDFIIVTKANLHDAKVQALLTL